MIFSFIRIFRARENIEIEKIAAIKNPNSKKSKNKKCPPGNFVRKSAAAGIQTVIQNVQNEPLKKINAKIFLS